MAEVRPPDYVKLFCGIIAVSAEAAASARDGLAELFGDIDLESEVMAFDFTAYYRPEMGDNLLRKFVSFATPVDPGRLADIKLSTNGLEARIAELAGRSGRRTVNLDPGYICPSSVVLASTKDFAHRIYLRDGIYAEVTLKFHKGGCVHLDWTFPDFRTNAYARFFLAARRLLLDSVRAEAALSSRNPDAGGR